MNDELRRIPRLKVCCRVVVRDRYGVWTAVTEDVCARGCRIVTPRLLRPGTKVNISVSSDLFPEEIEATATAVWAAPERLGVIFVKPVARPGVLSPELWFEKLLEHGATADSPTTARLVPSVAVRVRGPVMAARNGKSTRSPSASDVVVRMPARRGAPSA